MQRVYVAGSDKCGPATALYSRYPQAGAGISREVPIKEAQEEQEPVSEKKPMIQKHHNFLLENHDRLK